MLIPVNDVVNGDMLVGHNEGTTKIENKFRSGRVFSGIHQVAIMTEFGTFYVMENDYIDIEVPCRKLCSRIGCDNDCMLEQMAQAGS